MYQAPTPDTSLVASAHWQLTRLATLKPLDPKTAV